MTFTRSPKGLENATKFRSVDILIYTEGGSGASLTKEEIVAGMGSSETNDANFWIGLSRVFCGGTRVRVVSVGSCRVLEDIASDVVANDLSGVVVAFDRDYRDFWGRKFSDDRVAFTRGYSWESDLFEEDAIIGALDISMFNDYSRDEARLRVRTASIEFLRGLRPVVRGDQILVASGSQLFDREKPASFLVHDPKLRSAPKMDLGRVRAEVSRKKIRVKGFFLLNRSSRIDCKIHMFGKTLLAFAKRMTRHLLISFGQSPPTDEYVEHFLMRGFLASLNSEKPVGAFVYYRGVLRAAFARAGVPVSEMEIRA